VYGDTAVLVFYRREDRAYRVGGEVFRGDETFVAVLDLVDEFFVDEPIEYARRLLFGEFVGFAEAFGCRGRFFFSERADAVYDYAQCDVAAVVAHASVPALRGAQEGSEVLVDVDDLRANQQEQRAEVERDEEEDDESESAVDGLRLYGEVDVVSEAPAFEFEEGAGDESADGGGRGAHAGAGYGPEHDGERQRGEDRRREAQQEEVLRQEAEDSAVAQLVRYEEEYGAVDDHHGESAQAVEEGAHAPDFPDGVERLFDDIEKPHRRDDEDGYAYAVESAGVLEEFQDVAYDRGRREGQDGGDGAFHVVRRDLGYAREEEGRRGYEGDHGDEQHEGDP